MFKAINSAVLTLLGARKHTIPLNQEIELYIRDLTANEALTHFVFAKVELIVDVEDSPNGEKSLMVLAVQETGLLLCSIGGSLRLEDNTLHLESRISGLYALQLIVGIIIARLAFVNGVWIHHWLGNALFVVSGGFFILGAYLWHNLSMYRSALVGVFLNGHQY